MSATFDLSKPIAIGSDHAGFGYKQGLVEFLQKKGFQVNDLGVDSNRSVDYPDFAHPVSNEVEAENAAVGILICGSANGVAITANKHQGVRAAICWQTDIARLARLHNNANIVCIPARFIAFENACDIVNIFLETAFEGGRHEARVNKMACP